MIQVSVVRFVTVKKAAELTGYTEPAIRHKISQGIWPEGLVWKWGQDGVQLVNLEGYDKWASAFGRASKRGKIPCASSSTMKASEDSAQ